MLDIEHLRRKFVYVPETGNARKILTTEKSIPIDRITSDLV